MQRGENPNQLLSGVVFTQNQPPLTVGDKFNFETANWICQQFYFPENYVRGVENQANVPEFTGVQIFCAIDTGTRVAAGLDWVIQHYVPAVGWITEAEGTSVQSHAEGQEVWYDILFNEGIQPSPDSFAHRWRFCIRGRVGTGPIEEVVPYENDVALVGETEVNVKLFPDRPHPFLLNGVPSILRLSRADGFVYYSVQQGITDVWASRPNPLDTLNVAATTRDDDPLLISGAEVSLLFRLMGAVGDEGVDFLGNTYREAVRRNRADHVAETFGDEADTYWLSKPNPSRFAVESLYFDLRDDLGNSQVVDSVLLDPITPGVYFQVYYTNEEVLPVATRVNFVNNPHFATSDDGWTGVGLDIKERVTNQFLISEGSLHLTNAVQGDNYAYYRVSNIIAPGSQDQLDQLRGKTVTASAWVRKNAGWALTGGDDATIALDDGLTVVKAGSMSALPPNGSTPGSTWERQSVTMTVDPAATKLEVRLYNGGVGEVWWDAVLLEEGLLNSWFQGTKNDPPDAPVSIHDWEERIWNHVPKTYQMTKRDTHVLPEPITAKYMKVEFSHLQPRPYNAGDFPQPIAYKKHPRWVLDYFVARRELDEFTERGSNFAPRRVGVRYDALDLAYNYYLDDLKQEPDQPVNLDPSQTSQFVDSFTAAATADRADDDTLRRIKLTFDQFKQHPAIYNSNVLGITLNAGNYPVEYQDLPAQVYDTSALQDLHKESIVYELTYPVMFFFVPCRHRYKEVIASLTYNRAYFAGVRQVAFSREKYTQADDTDLYVESMGDGVNVERMDFVRVADGQYVTDIGVGL